MKKAKKRLIITSLLITILIVAFLFSGCSNVSKYAKSKSEKASGESAVVDYTCVSKPKSEKKIYVILKNYHGDYWKTVIEGIERAAKEIDAGVYLGGIDNETDIDGQISLMEKAVKEGADGILLAPANSNSLADSCEKVRKKKIPVVLIDSSINSTEFDVCYMTDNIDAGEMAAKEMLTMLHDTGNSPQESLEVGILLSSDASQAMVNRVSGFLDYWAKYAPTKWEITKDIALNGGDVEKAEGLSGSLSENARKKPECIGFFEGLEVFKSAKALNPFHCVDASDPYHRAMIAHKNHAIQQAFDALLEGLKTDFRQENSRHRLLILKLFNYYGTNHPLTIMNRKALSKILFS